MRAWLAVVLLFASGAALGQQVERETFSVIGWNDGCSVAISHYGYPFLGQAAQSDPVLARVGALTIPPGAETAQTSWKLNSQGGAAWHPSASRTAVASLVAAGYDRPGFSETVRTERIASLPGLEETIRSTSTFALRDTAGWPGPDWRFDQVHYSPLDSCGLLVFFKGSPSRPFYRYLLLRFHNPLVRPQRAQAHVTNSRLLFDDSDLTGAAQEAEIAARMTPQVAAARYQNAVMLCLTGRLVDAEHELADTVKLDPQYKAQAREDPYLETLRFSPRFQGIVQE